MRSGGLLGAQVGRRESFNAELSREGTSESIEVMRITARNNNPPISQDTRSGMIHPGNARLRQHGKPLPSCSIRIVIHGAQHGVTRLPPSLEPIPRTIDIQNFAIRQVEHISHGPPHRHVLHGPASIPCRRHNPTTPLGRRSTHSIRPGGSICSSSTDQNLTSGEAQWFLGLPGILG